MIFGIKIFPDGWRCPRALSHVFDSESKSVTFGWAVFASSTYGALFVRGAGGAHVIPAADYWWYVLIASGLVATKVFKEIAKDLIAARFGGLPPKEAKPDAPLA